MRLLIEGIWASQREELRTFECGERPMRTLSGVRFLQSITFQLFEASLARPVGNAEGLYCLRLLVAKTLRMRRQVYC